MIVGLAILLLVAVTVAIRKIRHPAKPILSSGVEKFGCIGLFFTLFLLAALRPLPLRLKTTLGSAATSCRIIALAEFQYANDNGERFPDGNSSTEVFQKLIDGNYVSDPAIFYVPMPGKIRPEQGERLKPENVCYDVTGGVDSSAPEHLPLVFLTGYKVDYRPGGQAISLTDPYPRIFFHARTWWEWLNFYSPDEFASAIAVSYHDKTAFARRLQVPPDGPGQTREFVPQDFDAHGKTYRQLTPDGVLK